MKTSPVAYFAQLIFFPFALLITLFNPCGDASLIAQQENTSAAAQVDPAISVKLQLVRKLEQKRIETIEKVKPAVVAVFGIDKKGGGSGVIIHPSGLALTNHHVVQGAGMKGIGGLADGKQYPWTLIGNDPGGDLALIKLHRKKPFPYVEMGDSDKVKVGDWTLVMGNPFLLAEDFNPTVTYGIVSGVKRYQKGMTDRLLVYGNCIQVDTSINPGNSGGPLFDMQGRLIGINGRASFDFAKRGRVNVGIGYAISVNQCRNFLPDLMATKLAQHGGLDAVFEDRDGKVVCSEIFEDAEIATLGMDIGDQLIEFEGEKILSANHFTNLLCTLPAGWPAKLTFRSQSGRDHQVVTRLVGLPYPKASPPPPRKKPKKSSPQKNPPKKSKDSKKDPKKKNPKRKQAAPNKKLQAIQKSKVDFFKFMSAKGNKIQNATVAGSNANFILQMVSPPIANRSPKWRIDSRILEGDREVGKQTLIAEQDGFQLRIQTGNRFQIWEVHGEKILFATADKEKIKDWKQLKPQPSTFKALSANPYALSAYLLAGPAGLYKSKGISKFSVDGSDSVNLTPCCRLKLTAQKNASAFAWFTLHDFTRTNLVRLTKTATDIDGSEGLGAVRYHDWQKTEFGHWPRKRTLVNGLSELQIQTWEMTKIQKMPLNR